MIRVALETVPLRDYLKTVDGRLRDLRTPNRQAAAALLRRIRSSFDRQKTPEGTPWKRLQKSTIRLRAFRGNPTQPALQETGYLRSGFRAYSGRADFAVENIRGYADLQNSGNPASPFFGTRTRLPARRFMPIVGNDVVMPDDWWDEVMAPFDRLFDV